MPFVEAHGAVVAVSDPEIRTFVSHGTKGVHRRQEQFGAQSTGPIRRREVQGMEFPGPLRHIIPRPPAKSPCRAAVGGSGTAPLGGILPSPWGRGMEEVTKSLYGWASAEGADCDQGHKDPIGLPDGAANVAWSTRRHAFEPVCGGLRTAGVPRLDGGTPQLPEQRKEASRGDRAP